MCTWAQQELTDIIDINILEQMLLHSHCGFKARLCSVFFQNKGDIYGSKLFKKSNLPFFVLHCVINIFPSIISKTFSPLT